MKKSRVGVFICHCGHNIARAIDIKSVMEKVRKYPGVVHVEDYIYFCSDPGQKIVADIIKEKNLDAIVIANCSPNLHEKTFRDLAESVDMNRFKCEIANIREQCSWPHDQEREKATFKSIKIIQAAIEKVKQNEELEPIRVPLIKRALVIGGGITGIQAALDIANGGFKVILLERRSTIGGRMAQLSETFPTLDCPQCIMTPKMVDVAKHENIRLMTYSELESSEGYIGNFTVKIKKKAKYVDWDKCVGCGDCTEKCPSKVDSEFDAELSKRKAIYRDFPQAVPNKFVIDAEHCTKLTKGKCGVCENICPTKAIKYDDKDEIIEEKIGAVIVATGFDLFPLEKVGEYGYGKYKDVIDGLQFERILAASGPTGGKVVRPSDGKVPKEVVFIQCVGSRDPEGGMPYCSRICCMYTAKQAMLYKHAVPDGQPYIFCMDIRSGGKGYEEFVQRSLEEDGVIYLRGRVSKIYQDEDKIMVWGADMVSGKKVEIPADLVVLATAMVPSEGIKDLASKLRIATDEYGFLKEAHLKLQPLETLTSGIFIAGTAQSPKDITDTVAQASGAASKVMVLFSSKEYVRSPTIARVDEDVCKGCGICVDACTYGAIELDTIKKGSKVNEALCEGCGACAAVCPSGAMQQKNYTKRQLLDMISVATEDYDKG